MPFLPSFKPELSLLFVSLRICYLISPFFGALIGRRLVIVFGCVSDPVGLVSPLHNSTIAQPPLLVSPAHFLVTSYQGLGFETC